MNATKFTFTNRETYLAFVSEWKAEYHELSNKIRSTKIEFKEAQRRDVYSEYTKIHYLLKAFQSTARQRIEDRHAAKELSMKMRAAAMETHHA